MKTLLLLSFLLLLNFQKSISQPSIQWQKSIGGSMLDDCRSVLQTSDGGYILAGFTESNDNYVSGNHGGSDFLIVKLSSIGSLQWEKTLGGTMNDKAYSIQQTFDGGYIIAGLTISNDGNVTGNHGSSDYWIVKLQSNGNVLWQKTYGGTGADEATSIKQTSDSGYIVAGYSDSNDGDITGNIGNKDFWIVKLNISGIIQWQKSYGGTAYDAPNSIEQTSDGGYVIAGKTWSNDGNLTKNNGDIDYWVIKIDPTGILQWQKSLGSSGQDRAFSVKQTNDGGYIVVGDCWTNDSDVVATKGFQDCWIVKLDSSSSIQWQKSLGGSSYDGGQEIQQTIDGGYIIAGSTFSNDSDITNNHGDMDYWVVKIDQSGNKQWQKTLGGSNSDEAFSIKQTFDGGFIVAGRSSSNDSDATINYGQNDFWAVKLSSAVGIEDISHNLSNLNIFPNPFSSEIFISFDLLDSKPISIQINDIEGKIVFEFSVSNLASRNNLTSWDGTNFSGFKVEPGVYLVSIFSDDFIFNKKIIFLGQ